MAENPRNRNMTRQRKNPTGHERLVIIGAAGSIGTALCSDLADQYQITAVTHLKSRVRTPDPELPVKWRQCDLFSRSAMGEVLSGADYVIYLAHARLPSARLDQAHFEDMELIIADNFARSASLNSIKQILCLRGLRPTGRMSELTGKRDEVVETLSAYGVPVSVIRAGLVVTPGSTLVNLIASQVLHGRIVPIPLWALTRKQPVSIADLMRAVRICLGKPDEFGGSFDIGGPEIVNWRQILEQTAELLQKKPVFLPLKWLPVRIYQWWLWGHSRKTHPAAIHILVRDLQHDSLAEDNPLQRVIIRSALDCRDAIRPHLSDGRKSFINPRSEVLEVYEKQLRESRSVRSIQRIKLPAGRNAAWMTENYFRWLESFAWPLVACQIGADGSYQIKLRGCGFKLLELSLQPGRSDPERRLFFITGGLLASGKRNIKGRMEFHDVLSGRYTIIAIHDFAPSLPWNLYHLTQATVHGLVMSAFQRRMEKMAGD
jgi:nucleoside-diphosphate-sugar epimerase